MAKGLTLKLNAMAMPETDAVKKTSTPFLTRVLPGTGSYWWVPVAALVVAAAWFSHAAVATETADEDSAEQAAPPVGITAPPSSDLADSAANKRPSAASAVTPAPAPEPRAGTTAEKPSRTAAQATAAPKSSSAAETGAMDDDAASKRSSSADTRPTKANDVGLPPVGDPPAPAATKKKAPTRDFPTVTPVEPFKLLGSEVPPGEVRQLSWFANQHYSGVESAAQVLVAHGSKPGKVLCVTAAIHGDEINGVEIARRVFYRTKPKSLAGTLVVVPITNLHGFERSYRYLADRRDLNRYFPGIVDGSSAARIAHSFFTSVIEHCDALVDLHTGSFHRTNLPQLRADLSKKKVVHLTHGFGATAVLDDKGAIGTLRRAATDAGIPAVVLEAGEPMRLQPDEVRHGAKAVKSLMAHLRMVKKSWRWRDPQPVYYESVWVRASRGGILMAAVQLGDSVSAGQSLGAVTDPISNSRSQVIAPQAGRVIGMAVNQMVRPGYAVFRIGIERTEAEIVETAAQPSTDDSSATPVTTSPAATSDPAQDDITDDASSDTDHSDE